MGGDEDREVWLLSLAAPRSNQLLLVGRNNSDPESDSAERGHTKALVPEGAELGRGISHQLRAVERPAPGSQLKGGEIWPDTHLAIAVWTLPGGTAGSVQGTSSGWPRRAVEKAPGERQQGASSGVPVSLATPIRHMSVSGPTLIAASIRLRVWRNGLLRTATIRGRRVPLAELRQACLNFRQRLSGQPDPGASGHSDRS